MWQIKFPKVQPTTGILFLPGCHSCSQREPLLLLPRLRASCFEVPSPVLYWVQFRKTKDHAVLCSQYPHTWATSAGILEIVTPYSVYTKLQQQIEVLSQSKCKYILWTYLTQHYPYQQHRLTEYSVVWLWTERWGSPAMCIIALETLNSARPWAISLFSSNLENTQFKKRCFFAKRQKEK